MTMDYVFAGLICLFMMLVTIQSFSVWDYGLWRRTPKVRKKQDADLAELLSYTAQQKTKGPQQ
jgi:hypothetical protein